MATNAIRYEAHLARPMEAECPEMPGGPVLLGESAAARRLRSQVRRIAPYFRTALIHGEAGTGKEGVARAMHAGSQAAGGAFVVAEAARVAEACGRGERAAARGQRDAELALAQGGTLYLKGVGELSFEQQDGLMQFLHATVDRRCGGTEYVVPRRGRGDARIRIVAGSDRDLRMLAAVGQFRQELYASLSAVEIYVPPLQERLEDIPALAEWWLRRLAGQVQQSAKKLTEGAAAELQKMRWPGNLRELERVVCQAAALAEGEILERRHVLALMEAGIAEREEPLRAAPDRLEDVIQRHVFDVLERCGGNKLRAAELLGISRSTLYRMLSAAASARAS